MDRPARPAPTGESRELPAQLVRVKKAFRDRVALAGVDLTVTRGEVVALLGPNGAGKTTALSILLGLRRPDRGEARLYGRDPREAGARRRVGATPQESGFPPTLTVAEIVDLVRAHYDAPAAAASLMRRFGLAGLEHRHAGGLSGGERRRLSAALAFAGNPDTVFLDEPTTGLDVESRRRVWRAVGEFAAAGGTVLLTTHNLEEADALATRVAVLSRGVVLADAPPSEIKSRAGLKRVLLRASALPALAGVVRARREGDRHALYTDDPGAVVRQLVVQDVPLDDLEIAPVSLEDAFLAVTGGEP